MNSSTLRRLAADHAMLYSELPPNYLFPSSGLDSFVDDLTQLTVLVTGPTGTPYSQGLWKLSLNIPETYPKAPPKATFRTRIWHPNVEENTGSVCVDTLKKDWQPKLTLRDVLITIYCLLIQPNPDSALNATAGHLLQDDYDAFARQARLMTSIHASIPFELAERVLEAKKRGQTEGTAIGEFAEQRPTMKTKSASSSSSVIMRKLPGRMASMQSVPSHPHQAQEDEGPATEEEDDESVSKENDTLLSPSPFPSSFPKRLSLAKRPLSDISIVEPECDMTEASGLSRSEQNVLNNLNPSAGIAPSENSWKGRLAESNQSVNTTGRGLQGMGSNDMGSEDLEGRPTKRICSDSGKENTLETWEARKLIEKPLSIVSAATKVGRPDSRKASASSSSGTNKFKVKPKVGLRRL